MMTMRRGSVSALPLRKTNTRAIALEQVVNGEIMYDSQGDYLEMGKGDTLMQVAGPRRRTFAELREDRLITPGAPDGKPANDPLAPIVPMLLTPKGVQVAKDWDLTSH